MNETMQLLQTYGGWAVSVLEGVAIVAMAKHIVALNREQREEAKELTKALVETSDAMKEQRRALERFFDHPRHPED
jgi:hypothetical protein